jgi:peptidyl-prolyl cis-trans isomerase D
MDNRKLGYRIFLGAAVLVLGGSMLLYLVPQGPASGSDSSDTVAQVGDQSVTVADIREQLSQIEQRNQVPKPLESLYARRILEQLLFQKEIGYEAKQLGVTVSNEEVADRIRQFLPTAFNGGTPIAMDQYTAQVQQRFQMTVPVFEGLIRQGLLEEKFRKLVTDGVSAGPSEIQDEFRIKNEKVKLDYVVIKPEDLESKITPDEAEIKAAYEKGKANYKLPERRIVRYGLIDVNQIRQSIQISDQELEQQYKENLQSYQVPNRVHVQHILLFTQGKPDAEVEEIKKKADDVLAQVKKGGKFDELAKKYSEDPGTKDKGGDLGWITQGQTVPEFEKTAFSLDKGQVSGIVKTQYGFHIIKVLEKESSHTKPFEEVKDSLRPNLMLKQADKQASETADKVTSSIRQSNKTSLDDLAKQFHLTISETRPVAVTDPLLELGNSPEIKDAIFHLRSGELSAPVHTDRGYVVLSLKDVLPAHQGSLEEVRDKVVADLKREKSSQVAQAKAQDLAKRVKGGEKFDAAARSLGLDAKVSEDIARNGAIAGVASGKQLSPAFQSKQGEVAPPLNLGANWFVYQVREKQEPNPGDFDKQKKALTDEVLQNKRSLAFEAFHTALDDRLKKAGTVKMMPDKMKAFGAPGGITLPESAF